MSETIINVKDFTAAYGENVIIDNITFDVYKGEKFVILGGSGCGKTTLLKHMIGLYRPANGSILIEGDDIAKAEGQERIEILKSIGVAYQSGALFGSMTVLENVMLPLEEYTDLNKDSIDLIARMKLNLVGLTGSEEKSPSELSGGMIKRAALARAMALDPDILFLDEPSAGLDPITSAELDQLIIQLSKSLGVTFVIVTHELNSIYNIADRVIMLDKDTKGIIASGDPKYLRDNSEIPIVQKFFKRQTDEQLDS
ncbi:MAG: ATP-binding cassette domain-containing protein [Thermodesulfobacteriales bacterium]|nr:MAG: ATP-binding cassette domain-containing protein [Thermodesulfobacteriales bacterium]